MHTRQSMPERKSGGLFEGLSGAQLVAGALAAVTSMLLSSQIGITGSVIGVAVGSVVSTVSSQLYKKFFQKGADKIRDLASPDTVGPNGTVAMKRLGAHESADVSSESAQAWQEQRPLELADERLRFSTAHDRQVMQEAAQADRAATGTTVVMPRLEDKAQVRRAARMKRNTIIVSVVAAIVAVALSALVVSIATAGNGIGYKTQPIVAMHETHAGSSSGDGGTATSDDAQTPGDDAADAAAGTGTDQNLQGAAESENGDTASGAGAAAPNTGGEDANAGSGGAAYGDGGSSAGAAGEPTNGNKDGTTESGASGASES